MDRRRFLTTAAGSLRPRPAWAAALVALGAHGVAADPAPALENVVVTGSRLARSAADSASPIAVVPGAAFAETGAVTVERTLAQMPQFVPTVGSTSNDPGNDGQANLSLRGLGPTQTLVLLDGRRLTPADGRATPDVNVLPPALIESVEIVTGGASAAYGSDAVAGVVNFRLREEFTGLEFGGRWSLTDRGDGEEYAADVTGGTQLADGRVAIVASLGHAHRDGLAQDARGWSRYPLAHYPDEAGGVGPGGAFLDSGAGITAEGVNVVFPTRAAADAVFAGYGYASGTIPTSALPAYGVNADGTLFTIGDQRTPGSVVNYRGTRPSRAPNDRTVTTPLADEVALVLPLKRDSVFLRATWRPGGGTEAFVQGMYSEYSSERRLGPSESGILLMPPTNPYVPADLARLLASRPNQVAPFRVLKRMTMLPSRVATNDRELLQVTAGVEAPLAGDWRYQAYAQHGANERTEHRTGSVLTGRVQELVSQPDGGAADCGAFNLFGVNPIAPECAASITGPATNRSEFEQWVVEATADGPLVMLPAGPLELLVGAFYKDDEFTYRPDELAGTFLPAVPGIIGPRPAVAGFPAAAARAGSESNTDVFAELRIPLLREQVGAAHLEAGFGYRRSDYERAGTFDSLKADLLYRPVQTVALRGSYQQAVRAPSVDELYYPQQRVQHTFTPPDPCSVTSDQRRGPDRAQVEALCLAQGLPPAVLPTFTFPLARVEGVLGGNPDLDPEESESYTVGVVYTPAVGPGAGRLQLAVDAYRIRLDDAIGRWDADSAVQRCYDRAYNADYDPSNPYCTYFTRSPANGEIYATVIDRNLGGIDTRGVDVDLQWARALGAGTLSVTEALGYVERFEVREPHGGTVDLAGTIGGRTLGGALPQWKSLLSVGWMSGGTEPYARWRWIDGMQDARVPSFEVDAVSYVDLGVRHRFDSGPLAGLSLGAGVDNATDAEPPLFPSWQQANTDPSLYDVLGRRWFVGAEFRY